MQNTQRAECKEPGKPVDRVVLIDTDTASDDAVALIMALRSPLIQVVAITAVAGNVPIEQATRNALFTVELCNAEVPVYAGASKPLIRELEPATWFHGLDGLGDCGYAPTHRTAEPTHAVDAMIANVLQYPGIKLITLGPLTNLAQAIVREPRIVANIKRCVVMGRAPCCKGNVTPAAEFNIWVDPEAAAVVMRSGLPIELVGWQLSRYEAVLNPGDIESVSALNTPLAEFTIRSNGRAREAYFEQTGEHGISLPDPVAMALFLNPKLALAASDHKVEIETQSPLTRGMTVIDRLNVTADNRNAALWQHARIARVIWEIDIQGWKELLLSALL